MKLHLAWPLPFVAAALVLSGCSDNSSSTDASSSESSSAATSTSAAAEPNPLAAKAGDEYKAYAVAQVDELVAAVKVLTDAVRAGDLKAAQDAYAPSRMPWERIEPLAELIPDIDGKVDSRVDDFEGPEDAAFTGWHRLEFLLFEKNTTEGGAPFADQLDKDIAGLKDEIAKLEVPPLKVATGAAELIEEVSQGKITGEEDRYSKTDLWDFDANLQGSQAAVDKLTPALEQADPALLGKIDGGISDIYGTLAPLRQGDGWVLFCTENDPYPSARCTAVTVTPQVVDTLKGQLAGLSENLSQVPGVLGLQ
ncbi:MULTISPECIES: EfeM/EfeO family lipoprotein [unclassified Mycolicibacterium]|uniref:EfeM/EfeO family lipoprotein n=1 Tax=unclassified Mycolicibacterium TaxID=2636767 RepID=UPI001F4BD3AD|nr:EfeM/EfeO family lipoprotein [Mycolicibacterium sp. YH-1]UNB54018.1 EfeM/EfeO family lipoprotein [Mycolicibacterium sp. YH-1]